MTTDDIMHVYPTHDDQHLTELQRDPVHAAKIFCWCKPMVELILDEEDEKLVRGLVVVHDAPDGYPGKS